MNKTQRIVAIGTLIAAIMIIVALLCAGCASTSGVYSDKAGNTMTIKSVRWFWQTDSFRVMPQSNGVAPIIEVNQTRPDSQSIIVTAETIGTIAGAAAKTAVKP